MAKVLHLLVRNVLLLVYYFGQGAKLTSSCQPMRRAERARRLRSAFERKYPPWWGSAQGSNCYVIKSYRNQCRNRKI